MKEAYFKGTQWTRTFVTGPLDPEHNKHKFYCQICQTNVSISTKGAREIVRHFPCESHFRKDQRWRFEHLRTNDKVTGQVVYEVRRKNGQVLTPLELEREKQYFMAAPLIETGCNYAFYEDYMAGLGALGTQAEVRLCVQISNVALISPRCGDWNVLQTLWSQIGTATNHQTLFSPFDWGSATLTVSIVNSWFPESGRVLLFVEILSLLFCLRPSFITSSCVACQMLHTMSATQATTLWSLDQRDPQLPFHPLLEEKHTLCGEVVSLPDCF